MGERDQGAGGRGRAAHSTAGLGRTGPFAVRRLAEGDSLVIGVVQRGHPGDGTGVPVAPTGLRVGGSEVLLPVFPAVMVVVVVPVWGLGGPAALLHAPGRLAGPRWVRTLLVLLFRGFTLTSSGRAVTWIGAVDMGRVAQRSAGAGVALGRPGGLLGFGTVVVLMLNPPDPRRPLGGVWRSPHRSGFQQGGRRVRFRE